MSDLVPEPLWEDGVLLRSEHLQALQNHCTGVAARLRRHSAFPFGVWKLKVREAALRTRVLELTDCELVTDEGTVVVHGETAVIRPCDFRDLQDERATLDVWLAIPRLIPNGQNLVDEGEQPSSHRRYVVERIPVRGENTPSPAADLRFRRLSALLMIEPTAEHRRDYETIRIARIKRVVRHGEEGRQYELDRDFAPACLRIRAADCLVDVLRDLLHAVEQKNAELVERIGPRMERYSLEMTGSPRALFQLQASNSVLALLRQLADVDLERADRNRSDAFDLHPFEVYMHLLRILGDLAIFSEDLNVPRVAFYDHENPYAAFHELRSEILRLLEPEEERAAEDFLPFEPSKESADVLEVHLPESFRREEVKLYLVVKTQQGEKDVLESLGRGAIKLLPPKELDKAAEARLRGIACGVDARLHPALRVRKEYVYLLIDRSDRKWRDAVPVDRLLLVGDVHAVDLKFFLHASDLRVATGAKT